ncbi:threonine ammonia-lyase IlvA [Ornithinimicrobium faecis]|uniref:L-threonine dehydratase n=1 Tax=Ornithinimicrobium faecis TaxID=2934158 RepID=A0ABY4YT73_9MICO|nr:MULTISPECIES: threonine ammonia-lyase IlvA [unclassified Ornithinimicrobium]USQ79934.1 threonine ammonia-lyase IlvA [Ornithinimicrobium sp. HY1793]
MTNSAPPDRRRAPTAANAATPTVTAADIDEAAERLKGLVSITPLTRSRRLSEATGAKVLLKREDQQPVRSYKNRGAINLIAQLDEPTRAKGVVCASAGNHAQGVAFACATLEVSARIFLPRTTPRQKRDRVAAIGGEFVEIVVTGSTYDAAAAAAAEDAERTGATLVPAFDHPQTIAGQGTVTREIVGVLGHAPDVLVVPVGGGGLLAGGLTWLREQYPDSRVVGVEPAGAASMAAALAQGGPVTLDEIDPFVDGAAVRRAGENTYPIVRDGNAELVSIAEGAVCVEMLAMYQTEGIITEPAGALAAAALPTLGIQPGQTVVVVVSGGNNDVSRYAEIVERALVHEGRKHYFLVDFPQEPGALRGFLHDVLGPDDDIALFEYTKRNNRETGPALVGIELGAPEDLQPLLDRMEVSPIEVEAIPPDSPLFRFIL